MRSVNPPLTEAHKRRNALMKNLVEKRTARKRTTKAEAIAQYHRVKAASSRGHDREAGR